MSDFNYVQSTNDTPTKVIINCTTGEVNEIPLTQEELAEREAARIAFEAQEAERAQREADRIAAKASAEAKLAALGLTPEEIAAL